MCSGEDFILADCGRRLCNGSVNAYAATASHGTPALIPGPCADRLTRPAVSSIHGCGVRRPPAHRQTYGPMPRRGGADTDAERLIRARRSRQDLLSLRA